MNPQLPEQSDLRLRIEGAISSEEYVRRLRARVGERRLRNVAGWEGAGALFPNSRGTPSWRGRQIQIGPLSIEWTWGWRS